MILSEKVLKLRKQSGMSQEDLAEKLGVSRQAVSRWEVGAAQPDASNILQLSKLFNVSTDYLLNDGYESEGYIPRSMNREQKDPNRIKKIISLCVSAFGLFGNFVIYILSRFIAVYVPIVFYKDGKRWYQLPGRLGYSYKYFIKEHHLGFLITVFWILFAAGLTAVFLNRERVEKIARICKDVIEKYKEKKQKRRRQF